MARQINEQTDQIAEEFNEHLVEIINVSNQFLDIKQLFNDNGNSDWGDLKKRRG